MRQAMTRGTIASVLSLAAFLGCAARRTVVTARDLVEAPDRFDGARIVLIGQVQDLRFRTPAGGNGYTSFTLADGTARVPVFGWSKLDIDPGDLSEVRGVFHRKVQAGTDTLFDTVEADFVRRLRAGPQLPGPTGPP